MPRSTRLAWLAACAPQLLLACALALASDGVYHDDDLTHYLMARWSWTDPVFLLHDWGRPGFTIPYAAVGWLSGFPGGLLACRFLTIAIVAASAVLACATAQALGVQRAWLAGPCLLAMPLYFRLSYTTLTETVCGLYLIAGTWLLATGRSRRAALVLALAPITRHEAVVFLALAAIPLAAKRDWVAVVLLGWAETAWNLAGAQWYWMLPIRRYLEGKPILGYGEGGTLHYALMWGIVATPVLAALSVAGIALAAHRLLAPVEASPRGAIRGLVGRLAQPRHAGAFLAGSGVVAMVAVQTALYARNTYASGGYPRFLVPACPWMAVLAVLAIEALLDARSARASSRGRRTARGMAAIAGLVVGLLPTARGLTPDATGMIAGLYNGVCSETLAYLAPPFAVLGLAYAGLADRRLLSALLVTAMAWVAIEWGGTLGPLRLGDRQYLLAEATEAAVRDAARGGRPSEIVSSSPWVPYFARRACRASGPSMLERWRASGPDAPLYLVLDSGYSPLRDREELLALPHRLVYAGRLGSDDPYAVHVYVRR